MRVLAFALVAVALYYGAHAVGITTTGTFHHDLQASDLAVPPEPLVTSGFAFSARDAHGAPVRFDPCRSIHYVVYIGHGPLNGANLVAEGIRRLSLATGLHFVDDGTTDKILTDPQHQKPSDPVWIGWARAEETHTYDSVSSILPDEAIGVAGPITSTRPDGQRVYVTGSVTLRPTYEVTAGFGPGASEGNVLLHELGHLVGLAHVADARQLMYPASDRGQPDGYAAGDLAGLYQLGSARGCL